MNYKRIRVPFLNNEKIKKQADLFRVKYSDNSVPVDIERIIDLRLQINIVAIPDLAELCDTDALISSNWTCIYVDKHRFLDEDRFGNRLRFSLAHEIGHFVLHKEIYSNFQIREISDFYKFLENVPQNQYNYLEVQANKFANHLLVPREILRTQKNKTIGTIESSVLKKIDKKTLDDYLAIPISKFFGVSEEVVGYALNDLARGDK